MATRAYWSGRIRLALVSIPVEVLTATKSTSRIAFNQIHEPTGKRVRYEKVVPGVGPVEAADIVKGYEVEKNKYVLLTDEEINDVKLEAKKSIDLSQFVDEDAIDPVFFDRPFYVVPSDEDEDAAEAYIVLRDALKKTKKIGLGQLVVRGQGSIVAIKPYGKGLLMETLRYADEIKKPGEAFDNLPSKKVDPDLVSLAEELIEKKAGDFQPEKFKDTYTVALRELIKAKQEKRAPREIEEAPPVSNVINLMDALKRSVGKGGGDTRSSGGGEAKASGRKAKSAKTKSAKTKSAKTAKKASRRKAA
ncbi:Ku protein [Pseudorhodoplanes sp.]|jgi:DNA end-binding protein Ku|uniref:non-homologous end joining protein Ku n=1 Tax=Pseudorhodoplanes sp. TaxID=1934341 RepID=UPI002CBAC97B|nr:Ku protein [Pseudorhodoplanes sp.]HWV42344.1 Ku protein [Pseudorhodoplanes sp.]